MTIAEMHTLFKLKLDKTNSLSYPSFESEEIDLWLNQAQEVFVKTRYGGNNLYGTSAEETQKRSDDLRELLRQSELSSPAAVPAMTNKYVNTVTFTLPADYMFSLSELLEITYTCAGATVTENAEVKAIGMGSWSSAIRDPFNKPNKRRVLRIMNNGFIDIVTDKTTTPVKLFLRYYKTPLKMSLSTPTDCELAEHTHSEIVDQAVLMAIENIESPRVQTAPLISSKIE